MKRALTLLAALTPAIGAFSANANLLTNGNMDSVEISSQLLATPTGWVVTSDPLSGGVYDGMSSEDWNNVADAGGKGVFVKSFQGTASTPFDASLYQNVPGTPGEIYELRGWVGSGPGYSGEQAGTTTQTLIGIQFLNSDADVIGGNMLSLTPAQLQAPGSFWNNNYNEYVVNATAPAGTVAVQARFAMVDGYPVAGAGDGAICTDNYTLTVVPEPTSLAFLGFASVLLRRRSR